MSRKIGAIIIALLLTLSPLLIFTAPEQATAASLPAAKIIFTFDDGWTDQHTYALPIMQAAGFKGTLYALRDAAINSWPGFMSTSQINDLYNAGWDISNHTTNHDDNGADTTAERLATLQTEYQENQSWLLSNGWTRGAYHAAYPSGNFSNQLITILKGMGVLTGRSVIDGNQSIPVADFFRIPVQYVEAGNVAMVKASVNSAIQTGSTIVLMIHKVRPKRGNLVITTADFQKIVDYVKSKNSSLAVMTMSEWYNTVSTGNNPPVLAPIGNKSIVTGQLLTFTVSATDADGAPLTYSASNLPAGATFDTTTHAFSWTPTVTGTFSGVRFSVSDGSLSDYEDIAITVTTTGNNPPVLAPIGNKNVITGQLLTFTLSATDADNDPLTYSASNLPSGSAFDTTTHAFSWTPATAGTYPGISFSVSDGTASTAETITVTVTDTSTAVEILIAVATGSDDGFSGSWGFYNGLSWNEVGNPGAAYNEFLRFNGITIPQGATITAAHLEVNGSRWDSGVKLLISAEKNAAPVAPTSTATQIAKVRTTASVPWTTGYADWAYHNSPDFTSVIQELVNAYDYANGSIQILVDNNGSVGEAVGGTYESGSPVRLYIKWQ